MSTHNPLPVARRRTQFIGLLVLIAMGMLIHRLFVVQVYEGEEYSQSLRKQTTISILLPPARGSIMDRNGIPLAENRASFDIDIYLRELVGHYSRSHRGRLPKTRIPIGTGKNRRMRTQADVAKIVDETSSELFKVLDLEKGFTDMELARHYYQTPNIPFQLAQNLDFETLSQFAEKNIQIPGVQETARPVRQYPFGALAPHVLGYLGRLEEPTDADYQPDFVGKEGVESALDSYLQGKPGGKILRKNNLGFILGEDGVVQPRAGHFIYLTIDARIQWIAEKVMRKVGRGAAIVMNPNNGDILAMVSVPNFDPNDFVPKLDAKTWKNLNADPTHPLYNRAISTYAAGSIFKPFIALAALENKEIDFTPRTIINSPGAVWMANRWWRDWSPGGQGAINLRRGMAMSCNTFFYQLGAKTGIDSIVDMCRRFGLGEKLLPMGDGTEVIRGESAGVLPGPKWMEAKEKRKLERWRQKVKETGNHRLRAPYLEKWSLGHTLNTSIGQGYVEVTPLQMASSMCAIANGGHVYYPRLVMGVARIDGGELETEKDFSPKLRNELGVSEENAQAVRNALLAVVKEGTGRRAGIEGWDVAGKTGTAQFTTTLHGQKVKDLRAWFNGFAPYESPRYVVTVVVEGGRGGGSTAGPLVSEILKGIKEMEDGKEIEMHYLSPSIGHFAGVKTPPTARPPEREATIESVRGLHRRQQR